MWKIALAALGLGGTCYLVRRFIKRRKAHYIARKLLDALAKRPESKSPRPTNDHIRSLIKRSKRTALKRVL